MTTLLGIDVSTAGVKALLTGEEGSVLGVANTGHPLSTPHPLWSEQNPADWWQGAARSIRQVLSETGIRADDVAAVGLTGQMHSLTLLDKDATVLRPAMLWNDQRTGPQCDVIRDLLGRQRLIDITGNDALTGYTAPKILWVREHEPEIYAHVQHVLLPKDCVRLQLTGEYATDRAGAAATLLFDIRTRDWSTEIIDALGIPPEWLPPTHEGPEITGVISDAAGEATGLRPGTPVVGGAGDQAAQAVGVGAVRPGIVALTLGTGGNVFASTDEPFIEDQGRLHSFCHAIPGRWHLMGVMLSAGGSLRWYRDAFQGEAAFDDLINSAEEIPAGSEGLIFLPYLTGERTPHGDPLARGAFFGLTLRHTQPHFVRAILEGVCYAVRDSFEMIRSAGQTDMRQVRISGGCARSPAWRQILADVLDLELTLVNSSEGAAYGAALLAGVGVGVWEDVDEACEATVELVGSTSPNPARVPRYTELFEFYRELYPTTRQIAHGLSRLSLDD